MIIELIPLSLGDTRSWLTEAKGFQVPAPPNLRMARSLSTCFRRNLNRGSIKDGFEVGYSKENGLAQRPWRRSF